MLGIYISQKTFLILSKIMITAVLLYGIYNGVAAYRMFSAMKHDERGDKLLDKQHYAQAEHEFGLAIRFNPNYGNAHYHLGIALYQNGKLDASIKEFRKAVEIVPDFSSAYYYLGNAINDKGQRAEARVAWQRVVALPMGLWTKAAQEHLNKYPQITQ